MNHATTSTAGPKTLYASAVTLFVAGILLAVIGITGMAVGMYRGDALIIALGGLTMPGAAVTLRAAITTQQIVNHEDKES